MARLPHILIFNPDQWRGDVMGHLGDAAAVTPNLDRMVRTDAVSFRHAYCQNPVCTPSRCSFMSGWYPHVRGHRTMFHMMRPDEPVLLKTLKDNGYYVWWGGKNDLVRAQNGYGAYCDAKYDPPHAGWVNRHVVGRGAPGTDLYYSFYVGRIPLSDGQPHVDDHDWAHVHGAIDMIRAYAAPAGRSGFPTDKPLCIYLPLGYPHPPYAVEEPWYSVTNRARIKDRIPAPADWSGKPSTLKGVYDRLGMKGWSEDRWRELRGTYYGMCSRTDHQFGLVCQALKEAGMYDDTAIFFFSDHGDFTGDYGLVEKTENTFEEVLTRVPFVIKPPRGVPVRPRVSEALVELIDFPATVEALTGIGPSHDHFGKSLLPVLAGETDALRDAVFAEGGRRVGETQAMGLAAKQDEGAPYWPRVGLQQRLPEHSYAAMCRTRDFKYVRRLYELDEFYDLRRDPGETRNLINDPAYAGEIARHRDRLLRFFMETADVVPRDIDRRV